MDMMKKSFAPSGGKSAKPTDPGSKPSGRVAAAKGSGLTHNPKRASEFLKAQDRDPPKC